MEFEWDEAKDAENRRKHGLALADAVLLDWDSGLETEDERIGYGEKRFRLLAMLETRLHVCIYTLRDGRFRIISIRRANDREAREYDDPRR
jgi:uncharacterized protein